MADMEAGRPRWWGGSPFLTFVRRFF